MCEIRNMCMCAKSATYMCTYACYHRIGGQMFEDTKFQGFTPFYNIYPLRTFSSTASYLLILKTLFMKYSV